MYFLNTLFYGQWFAASSLTGLSIFLAQTSPLSTVERMTSGTILAMAASSVVYFTLRFSANQRDGWEKLLTFERDNAETTRALMEELRIDRDLIRAMYDDTRVELLKCQSGLPSVNDIEQGT